MYKSTSRNIQRTLRGSAGGKSRGGDALGPTWWRRAKAAPRKVYVQKADGTRKEVKS